MSIPNWSTQLYPKLGITKKISINQTVAQGEGSKVSSRTLDYEQLHQYDISKIKPGKTKNLYTVRQLQEIADILKVKKNLSKQELVDEILRVWKNRYPEDFAGK